MKRKLKLKINWFFSIAAHAGVLFILMFYFSKVALISSSATQREKFEISMTPPNSFSQATFCKKKEKPKTAKIAPKKPTVSLPNSKIVAKEAWEFPQQDTEQEHITPSSFATSKLPAIRFSFKKKVVKKSLKVPQITSSEKTPKVKTSGQAGSNKPQNRFLETKNTTKSISHQKSKTIAPIPLHQPYPRYPRRARIRKLQGRVLLKIEVLTSGNVGQVKVMRPSRYSILNRAAVSGVRKWRFKAALQDRRRIVSWLKIPIVFRLP